MRRVRSGVELRKNEGEFQNNKSKKSIIFDRAMLAGSLPAATRLPLLGNDDGDPLLVF